MKNSNINNNLNNSLWIGELDSWMDEKYLQSSCLIFSKYIILFIKFLFERNKTQKNKNNKR